MIVPFTVGREAEIAAIEKNVSQGLHTLLLGTGGVGKTHLLLDLQRRLQRMEPPPATIYIPRPFPAKETAAAIYTRLSLLAGVRAPKKIVQQTRAIEIAEAVITVLALPSLRDRKIVLLLDEIDQIHAQLAPFFDLVADKVLVVAAGRPIKKARNLDRFFWRFQEIEVRPLSAAETLDLAERALAAAPEIKVPIEDPARGRSLFSRLFGPRLSTRAFLVKRLATLANGIPAAVIETVERLKGADKIDAPYIREILGHRSGERFIDGTPVLLCLFVFLVVMRYVNRGMYQFDMYAIFGALSGFMLLVRYFMTRGNREPTS